MTAIVGLFGTTNPNVADRIRRALAAMHVAGTEHVELWQEPADLSGLGAVTDSWQVAEAGSDRTCLAVDEHAAVATDASLYYLSDLERALKDAGQSWVGRSPAALMLAAFRAWGHSAVLRLEGDFAILVWDRRERRVVAARDHTGTRTLYHARYDGGLAVASRLDGLVALPGFDSALDLMSLGNDALVLRVHDPERTVYANARRLPAGHILTWHRKGDPKVDRWWEVPYFVRGDGPPFNEALPELRRLIVAAVSERTKHPGGGAIWLSGGYDSPALYAASHSAARDNGIAPVKAVSVSYPKDDPGYEDDYIEAATTFWNDVPAWVDVTAIAALEEPVARARLRDETFHHSYELWNAALAKTTQEQGCRVALIGNGGDQFFSASTVRLVDHLRGGRLLTLAREWREAGGGNWKAFLREVVAPILPNSVRAVAALLRQGRPLQHRLARLIPRWTNGSFEHLSGLITLNQTPLDRRPGESYVSVDQSWSLRHVAHERVVAALSEIALIEGVQVRHPLFDSRVIRFAAGRPLAECYSRRENKRLLRGAFAGLLPEKLLGPRPTRTGQPLRYFKRTAAAHAQFAAREWTNGMILAEMGVIEGRKFLTRVSEIPERGLIDLDEGVAVVAAVQAECWLRARQKS